METIRIATWNLKRRSPNGKFNEPMQKIIEAVGAHIWIFTEVRTDFHPGGHLKQLAISRQAKDLAENERWTAIWADKSCGGEAKNDLHDPTRTACAWFDIDGMKFTVYGTVLPWKGSKWGNHLGMGGEAFNAAIEEQKKDWETLAGNRVTEGLCVAGDFNQDQLMTGSHYTSKDLSCTLNTTLKAFDLKCCTSEENAPHIYQDKHIANVDHICLRLPTSRKWKACISQVKEAVVDELEISDHPCFWVDVIVG